MVGSSLTISGGGLVWTSAAVTGTPIGWAYGDRVWWAEVTTGASMTITADAGAFDIHDYKVEVDEFTGYDTATKIGATATGSDADGDGAASITLSASPASGSYVLAYALCANNGGAFSPVTNGTGWTEISETGVNDWVTFQSQQRTGSTSTGVGWDDLATSGAVNAGAVLMALEILASGGGGGGVTVKALSALGVG
jgi:hypothetical protein